MSDERELSKAKPMLDITDIDAFVRAMDECYRRTGLALTEIANESPLPDQGVLGAIQMVYGDLLARMTNDPTMRQRWLDWCEEFQKRHFAI